jgi:hypothetical protein
MTMWRSIKNWEEEYEVSEDGAVRSLSRVVIRGDGKPFTVKPRLLKPQPDKDGYLRYGLARGGEVYPIGAHRLVALAFLPPANGRREVNHIDNNPTHNHFSNLEWCSSKENSQHAVRLGVKARGERMHAAKLTGIDIRDIRRAYQPGRNCNNTVSLAAIYEVSNVLIGKIVRNEGWKHVE